jgi:nitronate monooxygenase
MVYQLRSVFQLKRASLEGTGYKDYFQAGKSVDEIDRVEPVGDIIARLREAAAAAPTIARSA